MIGSEFDIGIKFLYYDVVSWTSGHTEQCEQKNEMNRHPGWER